MESESRYSKTGCGSVVGGVGGSHTANQSKRTELLRTALASQKRPRLVFAFDATASREPAWHAAKQVTDSLFTALPGAVDVALAVHGGGNVHTFTDFSSDVSVFRDKAASVRCQAGETALIPLMDQVLQHTGIKVLLYIGDCFEECTDAAFSLADSMRSRGIRGLFFHDASTGDFESQAIFEEIARRTGGACFDFHHSELRPFRELLDAVVVFATGGVPLLEQKKDQFPGATRLLPYLKS